MPTTLEHRQRMLKHLEGQETMAAAATNIDEAIRQGKVTQYGRTAGDVLRFLRTADEIYLAIRVGREDVQFLPTTRAHVRRMLDCRAYSMFLPSEFENGHVLWIGSHGAIAKAAGTRL